MGHSLRKTGTRDRRKPCYRIGGLDEWSGGVRLSISASSLVGSDPAARFQLMPLWHEHDSANNDLIGPQALLTPFSTVCQRGEKPQPTRGFREAPHRGRVIPSFCMRDCKVVRFMPSLAAAPAVLECSYRVKSVHSESRDDLFARESSLQLQEMHVAHFIASDEDAV